MVLFAADDPNNLFVDLVCKYGVTFLKIMRSLKITKLYSCHV